MIAKMKLGVLHYMVNSYWKHTTHSQYIFVISATPQKYIFTHKFHTSVMHIWEYGP